jgi:hypothetical protein
MKYVYVLTSSQADTYYEQFFLSLASFRMYNPKSPVVVLTDRFTKNGLTGSRTEYEKYSSETKVIDVPEQFSQKEASRWIKTSIRRYISGDFLYIDCDTIITDNLEYAFPDNIIIGAVSDCHVPLKQHHYYRQFRDENLKLGFESILKTDIYYNGGIIFCRDVPESHVFYDRWHALWKETLNNGNSQDMPSLNRANYELHNIISEMGGEWNCQIGNNGLPFLYRAKIIHYFATSLDFMGSPFVFASDSVLLSIKTVGKIPQEVSEKLQHPKSAFELKSKIISDEDALRVLDSSVFSALRRIAKKNKKFFETFDAVVYRLSLLLKKLKRRKKSR